jgi:nitrile hydratase
MNGAHDLGGMQNFGPVSRSEDEAVFHEPWEGRIWAMRQALKSWRKWNMDTFRYTGSMIPPADYLRLSYFERFAVTVEALLVRSGLATRAEIESGVAEPGSPKAVPPLAAADVPAMIAKGASARRDLAVAASFQVGQVVRARNMHPVGHTRLPRYARGRLGTVERDHGVFVFPDTNAENLGEKPQHVYTVRFAARELWGDVAGPRDAVYIDLWDDYLERV